MEEGEILRVQEGEQPSLAFQEALNSGSQVITDPSDEVKGLQVVTSMVKSSKLSIEEDMNMDEIRGCMLEKGIDMDSEEFLKDIPEENIDDLLQEYDEEAMEENEMTEEAEAIVGTKDQKGGGEDKEEAGKGQGKTKGSRRRLPISNGALGSNKLRAAAAVLLSPRKAKGGSRQEGSIKPKEGKGAPLPPITHKKI